VTRATTLLLICLFCSGLAGQERNTNAAEQDALDWAVALGKRFRELHDPVVAAYSLGILGGIVCSVDRAAGTEIYRESLERLKFLTPAAFTSAQHHLPVPSFSALWKSLTPAALKCAPELQALTDDERAQAKMQDERQRANLTLGDALASVTPLQPAIRRLWQSLRSPLFFPLFAIALPMSRTKFSPRR